jgi:hypothetical protein
MDIAVFSHGANRQRLAADHTRCGRAAELRSVILKARRLVHDDAESARAAAAVRAWLLDQIEKKRAAWAADIRETAPTTPFLTERLAA